MNTIDKSKSLGGVIGAGSNKATETKESKKSAAASGLAEQASLENSRKLMKSSVGVDLSTNAKERAAAHKKAFDIAKATPEIREDRVAELKAAIASGKYTVDAEKVADGVLKEALLEHLALAPDET